MELNKMSSFLPLVFIFLVSLKVNFSVGQACGSFTGWEDYYDHWERVDYRFSRTLFPFGVNYCDTSLDDTARSVGFNPHISFQIPFYGAVYKSLWVSPHGFVALDTKSPPTQVSYKFTESWPDPLYPVEGTKDPAFIAPFYAKADFRRKGEGQEPSEFFYRLLDPSSTSTGSRISIIEGTLDHLSQLIRDAVIGAEHFMAQKGIVITWSNVTFDSAACSSLPQDTCRRNTYQLVIVTDSMSTYTINNYYDITWVGSAGRQQCDPNSGTRTSSYPNCFPAQAGFNAGNGRGFTAMPYSNDDKVAEYDIRGGSNVTGRYYYDVSGNTISHGGCTNDTNLGSSGNWPLVTLPKGGPMFGGNVVNVSGPCFTQLHDIVCRFGDVATEAIYTGNMMKAMCVAPMQYRIGYVNISVSVNGGRNYYFSNNYLNEIQERLVSEGSEVKVINPDNDWLNPSRIRLEWRALNLTSGDSDRLTIKLMGYKEENTQAVWQDLYTFQDNYANQGLYEFQPGDNMCGEQNEASVCLQYDMGAFRISVNEWIWNPSHPRSIWSEPIPLGWFLKSTLEQEVGEKWASSRCSAWYMKDSQSPSWRSDLPLCPCTLPQAYVDFGRFLPDLKCNMDNKDDPTACTIHRGSEGCFKANYVSRTGSSITCCYDNRGNLMYSGDSVSGSTAHRSSPSGRYPYSQPPKIPSLSHWMNDMVPYFYCCMWQTDMYDCYSRYMVARPTQDCKYYEPPGHATVYGDPHFDTFDGTSYTFNGHGEFWLVLAENAVISGDDVTFKLQGRMVQPDKQPWGYVNATYLTAISMQLNSGPVVSVSVNQWTDQEHLMVHVQERLLNFSYPSMYWQEFEDLIITTNDPHDQLSYSNFTIAYRHGIGIQVAWKQNLLHCIVSLPPEFKEKTGGLFGLWNNDNSDDLTPRPPGQSPVPPINTETIHNSFGLTWVVQQSESLFSHLYRSSMNYNWYWRPNYVPYFRPTFPPNNSISEADVTALCTQMEPCRYDYMVAQSRDIAASTKQMVEWEVELRAYAQIVPSCGWLEIANSIKEEPISYTIGSQVKITGCRFGFQLEGTTRTYTCRQSDSNPDVAYWSPGIGVKCVYTGGGLTPAMMAAITVPSIIVGILIIIGLILLCLWCRKRQKRKQMEKKRIAADQEVFNDLDVVGYGKNTQMFYNPNNPAVTGVGLPVMRENTSEKPKLPSSNGSPKIGPVGFDPLPKKADSSDSEAFYDKDSVEGVKVRADSTTSGGKEKTVPASPHSGLKVPLPDTMEKPEKEKKKRKEKKKKEKEKLVPENGYVSSNPMPTAQPQQQWNPSTGSHGRPKRPELKAEAPPAPKVSHPVVPEPQISPHDSLQFMHQIPQPIAPQPLAPQPLAPQPLPPHPVHPAPQPLTRLQYDSGAASDSSGSHGFHQQDLENFYRQKEAETQWLNEQNRPKTKKSRPYRYPRGDPRSNTMGSQGGYR